jgi:hypothetical protein
MKIMLVGGPMNGTGVVVNPDHIPPYYCVQERQKPLSLCREGAELPAEPVTCKEYRYLLRRTDFDTRIYLFDE